MKSSRVKESPLFYLLVVIVSFEDKDSSVSGHISAQAGGIGQPEAKQKVVAKNNSCPPSKRRKVPILNEEDVDNTLIENLKSSHMRPAIPLKVKITYPTGTSFDEEEEELDNEF